MALTPFWFLDKEDLLSEHRGLNLVSRNIYGMLGMCLVQCVFGD